MPIVGPTEAQAVDGLGVKRLWHIRSFFGITGAHFLGELWLRAAEGGARVAGTLLSADEQACSSDRNVQW